MANQEKCEKAMREVAEAVNRMFTVPLPKARSTEEIERDRAIQEAQLQAWAAEVLAKRKK